MRKVDENNQTVRCFPTKCRNCGKPVLYWENRKGSKVFFDYPILEKFRQHFCKIPPKIFPEKTLLEQEYERHHLEKFQCPICGKIFNEEEGLTQHLKDRKRYDPVYKDFFNKILVFDVLDENSENKESKGKIAWKLGNSSQFGKVIVRKNKKSKPPKNP